MAGGKNDYDDVTLTTTGESFTDITPLPEADHAFCIAAIDANNIFVTGLGLYKEDSYMFTKESNQWAPLPKIPTGRYGAGCGVVQDNAGKSHVVVAAGEEADSNEYGNTVEIYSVEDKEWTTGKLRNLKFSDGKVVPFAANNFPTALIYPAVAQHDESFYIIGGWDGSSYLDTIYHYNLSNDTWALLPNTMTFPRDGATAMIVKSTIFPSCG